ncbi:MAG: hypothetical protein V1646_01065 [bacterium]
MNKSHAFISNASRQESLLRQEIVIGQEIVFRQGSGLDTIFSFSHAISHTSFWSIYFNKRTRRGLDT